MSPHRACLSWSCSRLQSIHPGSASNLIGLDASLLSFVPKRVDFRVFAAPRTPELLNAAPDLLSCPCALLQSAHRQRAARAQVRKPVLHAASLEVWSPTAYPHAKKQHDISGGPNPKTPDAFRFSQPRGASLLRVCRPYFRADPLMGLSPSERCSSRAAVRRLRRLCPLVVGLPHPKLTKPGSRASPKTKPKKSKLERGRLAFRALLHTRVRHKTHSGLDRANARSSLGVSPLQGPHQRSDGSTFTEPPLARLVPKRTKASSVTPPQGFTPTVAGTSLARWPTLMGFPAF